MRLRAEKRSDGWWITGWPKGFEGSDCGPYKSKAEVADDKAGLEATLENWDNRSYWTTEKRK